MSSQQKIKILEVITKSNFGGAQKYVFELSNGLIKKGFDVVVAFGGDGILKEKLDKKGVRTITINSLQRNISIIKDIKTLFELIKIIKQEKPDIVHLNSSKIGALGSIATRFFSKSKSVFTIHGLAFKENRNIFSKIIILKIYWLTILLSNKSIAVSEQVKNDLLKFWFFRLLKNKIAVINNEIEKINFLNKNEAREKLSEILFNKFKIKINQNDIIVGSIGELHPIKGYTDFAKACSEITKNEDNLKFVIIGEGEERDSLQTLANDLNVMDKFIMAGFIEDAASYLKAFDIFVSTSLAEGLPLVILESMQAEVPIICTDVGSNAITLKEYLTKKIIQPGDTTELVLAINDFLKMYNNTEEVSHNSEIKLFKETKLPIKDTENQMIEKTSKVFLELLKL